MLRIEDVHKIYKEGRKDLHVLHGITLEIKKGQRIAIQGPSGAGKSTLLHILGGLDKPTAGKVFLDNTDFYTLPDWKRAMFRNRKIGFVFQFYHLLPEFSALENVLLPLLIKDGKGNSRAEELLREFGLGNRLHHRTSELSGGEQQRVAIARSIVNNPEILLCDEPTGNLDSKMGEEILNIIFNLSKRKTMAVVIVTHDKKIANLADKILQIEDGRII